MYAEWLNYGAYYLAMYRALSARGHNLDSVGKLIFETYEVMADYPRWFLRIVGRFKYGNVPLEPGLLIPPTSLR